MKRRIIFIFLVLLTTVSVFSTVVSNPDKPLKGELDLKAEKLWQISGFGDEDLAQIHKYVIHDNGDIFLFDRRHFKFFVIDKNGKLKFTFGRRGEGPGEIKQLLSFFLVDGHIVVSEMGKFHFFDTAGKYKKSLPTNSTIGVAPLLFLDRDHIVKTRINFDSGAVPEALEIVNLKTNKIAYLFGAPIPEDEKKPGRGIYVMINTGYERLERQSNFVAGQVGDRIVWGKNDAYLLKVSDFSGKEYFAFSVEGRERKKITEAYKKLVVSRMNIRVSGGPSPEDIKKRILRSMPDLSTFFCRIQAGKNGLIYVYVSDAVRENGQQVDIFSPQGKYLYRMDFSIAEGQRIIGDGIVFKGDFLYLAVEDPEGEISFQKYRMKNPPQLPAE